MKKITLSLLVLCSLVALGESSSVLHQRLEKNFYDAEAQKAFTQKSNHFLSLNRADQEQHLKAIKFGIDQKSNKKMRYFMLTELQVCGTKTSIPKLAPYLHDKDVSSKVSTVLQTFSQLDSQSYKEVRKVAIQAMKKAQTDTIKDIMKLCSYIKMDDPQTLSLILKQGNNKSLQNLAFETLVNCSYLPVKDKLLGAIADKGYLRSRNIKLALLLAQKSAKNEGVSIVKQVKQKINAEEVAFYLQAQSVLLDLSYSVEAELLGDLSQGSIRRAYGAANLLRDQKHPSLEKENLMARYKKTPNAALLYLINERNVADKSVQAMVIEAIAAEDIYLQNQALLLAQTMPAEQVVKPLIEKLFASPKDDEIKKLLMSLGHAAQKDLHLAWGQATDSQTKINLLEIYSERGDQETSLMFFEAIDSKDSKLRAKAIKLLKTVVNNHTEKLLALLKTASRSEQRYIVNALSADLINNKKNLDLLKASLRKAESEEALLAALAQSNYKETLVLIKPYLSNVDSKLRTAAVKALGTMTHLEAAELLRNYCGDEDKKIAVLATRGAMTIVVNSGARKDQCLAFVKALKDVAPESEKAKVLALVEKFSKKGRR